MKCSSVYHPGLPVDAAWTPEFQNSSNGQILQVHLLLGREIESQYFMPSQMHSDSLTSTFSPLQFGPFLPSSQDAEDEIVHEVKISLPPVPR